MSTLIVIEGADGTGKSTLARGLAKALLERGVEVITTREPGGTKRAEKIRQYLLSSAGAKLSRPAQLQLIHEGRLDHIDTVIKPAIESGTVVISDRFELSSWVYQVWPEQEEMNEYYQKCEREVSVRLGGITPQYVLLSVDSQTIANRLQGLGRLNHFDVLEQDKITDRLAAYETAKKSVRGYFHEVDASLSTREVLSETLEKINHLI